MTEYLEYVGNVCTEIINNPEIHLKKIEKLLNNSENEGVVFLALAKVFKSITPLYKIRLGNENINYKSEKAKISNFDKELLNQYNIYIKRICSSQLPVAFKCASVLLKTLDHFNFVDRLISKVLIGTTKETVSELCLESIIDRIKNDQTGETIYLIINQCLDYKFSAEIIENLLNCQYLEKCVEIRIEKEEKYLEKSKKTKNLKQILKSDQRKELKKEKEFFKMKKFAGALKKDEKSRIKIQKEVKMDELEEMGLLDDKNYIRTVNALQRLYFTILKERRKDCLLNVFIGVRKYYRIIRKEFHEGLYTLLNDNLIWSDENNYSVKAKIECVKTILLVFAQNGLDMKKVLLTIWELTAPINYSVEEDDFEGLKEIIEEIFINTRQSILRVNAILQRLIQGRCMRFIPCYNILIKKIEVTYDIDFKEMDYRNKRMYDPSIFDIDKISEKPFYEYTLFKRFL